MEEIHQHITLEVYGQYDPTRTSTLRNMFVRDLKRRFKELKQIIKTAIITKDCFGLMPTRYQMNPPIEKAFAFTRSADKVSGFMTWLQEQVDQGLLEVKELNQVGKSVNAAWTNKYIYDSYKRGVIRARYEMKKAGFDVPSIEATGGIEISMSTPFHLDRLGLLYTRMYTELKGTVTDMMDKQISRVLTEGIANGDNPRLLARKLVASIDGQGVGELGLTDSLGRFIPAERRAEILARTEIIRAHHSATMQEYRNWSVEGVTVQAEFKTAGDDRVCSQCSGLEGNIYPLDQVESLIPVHPQCRCVALPYLGDKEAVSKSVIEEPLQQNVSGLSPKSWGRKGYKGIKTSCFAPSGGSLEDATKNYKDIDAALSKINKKYISGMNELFVCGGDFLGSAVYIPVNKKAGYASDAIMLANGWLKKGAKGRQQVLLHEVGHRVQLTTNPAVFKKFKSEGLEKYFYDVIDEKYARNYPVKTHAGETFAQSFANFHLKIKQPEELNKFWEGIK